MFVGRIHIVGDTQCTGSVVGVFYQSDGHAGEGEVDLGLVSQ